MTTQLPPPRPGESNALSATASPADSSPPASATHDAPAAPDPDFNPADPDWLDDYQATAARYRHDGFTPDRQYDFLTALAECGCVAEACKRVGMSHTAVYAHRRRPDSDHFRRAWDAALDHAVERLSDAAFSRAINGTVRPVFYKGELVGERRFFDERLTMFILRYRDPARYGKWLDRMTTEQPADGPAALAEYFARRAHEDALADDLGLPRRAADPIPRNCIQEGGN